MSSSCPCCRKYNYSHKKKFWEADDPNDKRLDETTTDHLMVQDNFNLIRHNLHKPVHNLMKRITFTHT